MKFKFLERRFHSFFQVLACFIFPIFFELLLNYLTLPEINHFRDIIYWKTSINSTNIVFMKKKILEDSMLKALNEIGP